MKRFIIFLLFIFLGVNISYAYGEDNSYNNFVLILRFSNSSSNNNEGNL